MTIVARLAVLVALAASPLAAQDTTTPTPAPEPPTASAPDATVAPNGETTLSTIIAAIETEDRFGSITSIDWDEDGYWEIQYRRDDGARIDIDVDASTGQPWVAD